MMVSMLPFSFGHDIYQFSPPAEKSPGNRAVFWKNVPVPLDRRADFVYIGVKRAGPGLYFYFIRSACLKFSILTLERVA